MPKWEKDVKVICRSSTPGSLVISVVSIFMIRRRRIRSLSFRLFVEKRKCIQLRHVITIEKRPRSIGIKRSRRKAHERIEHVPLVLPNPFLLATRPLEIGNKGVGQVLKEEFPQSNST